MPKILLVDDNPGDQHLVQTLLRKYSPTLDVEICADGELALARLTSPEPDFELALVDWNVPRRNGREILVEFQRSPFHRRTPIVVLTSSEAASDVGEAYDLGASGYVVKPMSYKELAVRLRALVDYWFSAVALPPRPASDSSS